MTEILSKLYNAVAIALAYIYKLDKGEKIDKPEIEIPDDFNFDNLEIKMFNRNISKLIVTFAFFYSAVICHLKAVEFYEKKIIFIILFMVLCFNFFLGALRFSNCKIVRNLRV